MNIINIELSDNSELIKRQPLCFECDLKALLRYYGKDYAFPLSECFDFGYNRSISSMRITDRLEPIHNILSVYGKYGLAIKKIPVRKWKEYKQYIHDQIQGEKPMIIHFDCFYLEWDPAYKKFHNNHTLLLAGIENERVYLVDPAFNKEEWVEEDVLETASCFYYEIEGIESYEEKDSREVMVKKIQRMNSENYFEKFDWWAKDLRSLTPTEEFFTLDFFEQFIFSEFILKVTRIITNKYRFSIFLKEWGVHDKSSIGRILSFRGIISDWQVFKALLIKAYHQQFSAEIMNKVADYLLKIKQDEKSFLDNLFLNNIKEERSVIVEESLKYHQEPFDIFPYCNNKGIAKEPHTLKADCTGLGEYVCSGEQEAKLKELGYTLLSTKEQDNIRCSGQIIPIPKQGKVKGIKLLVAAEWGNYETIFKVSYSDGTEGISSALIKDWFETGEKRIPIGSTYYSREKKDELFRDRIYGDEIIIFVNEDKGCTGLILPICVNLHILSIVLLY